MSGNPDESPGDDPLRLVRETMITLNDLQRAIGGTLTATAEARRRAGETPLGKVVTDSRRVEPQDVFWGLVGGRYDGADFAPEAFRRGAAGVVVTKPVEAPHDRWVLQVEDALEALHGWAAWNRQIFTGTVIAVTGSVGKTTTREMIHTVLRTRLTGTASPQNYNNHVGVPLSMLEIAPEHDYAVLELGASRSGEIAGLARLCRPSVGVVTKVGDAHLGGFGSRQGIAEAKVELLAVLPEDGCAVLGDDPWLRRAARACRARVSYVGRGAECDVTAADVNCHGGKLAFRVGPCTFSVPVWGRHHLTSALAAVAVGQYMGFELEEIASALEHFNPIPMRCEVIDVRGAKLINDAYNASPVAMKAALELLRDFDAPGKRIAVCGDMGELGDEAPALHRRLGNQVVTLCGADLLIACGRHARDVVLGARAAGMPRSRSILRHTAAETAGYLVHAVGPGDVVLVKGSRSMAMEQVVDAVSKWPRRRGART